MIMDKITNIKNIAMVYKKFPSETKREEWFGNTIGLIRTYVPISEKLNVIDLIISSTMAEITSDENGIKKGNVRENSVSRYLLYVLNLINLYSNVEIDFKDVMDTYDLLKESGLAERIVALIPEKEIIEFKGLLEMARSDFEVNHMSNYALLTSIEKNMSKLFDGINESFIKPLTDSVEKEK